MRESCPLHFKFKNLVLALTAMLLVSFPAAQKLQAQSIISGDIVGAVTDPSGAAVAGATVTVTSKATDATQTATTSSDGSFRVPLLKPGDYTVVVSAAGFEKASLPATVALGVLTRADVRLTLGSTSQTVEVTGTATVLHTEAADLSTSFTLQQVQSLPNPGNDLTFVAQTAPGTVMNTQSGYGNFSAFGLPATSNTFTVNGGYENDPFLNVNNSGATNLLLGNNDVSDVSVISNAYNASFGGLGGAQINESTRAGSNKLHGNVGYWWNGRVLNANDFFNNQTDTPRPFDNVNQWAAAVGGPIRKDKTFFFVNYEGLRVVLPTRSTVYAPDASYEAATLANLANMGHTDEIPAYNKIFALYNNAPGYSNGVVSTPDTPDNPYGTVRFNGTAGNFTHEYLINGRIDQNFGEKDHLFGHMEVDKGLQATYTNVLNPIFNADSPQPQYQGQLNETHTFSPKLTNQFLFATIYYRAIFTNTSLAAATQQVPFSLIFADGDLGSNGTAAWPGGLDIIWPQGRNVTGYQFTDDVSWNHGNHNIQFGWTIRRDDVTDYSPSEYTASPEAVALNGSFQTGTVDEWVQQFPQRTTQPVALYAMGWYLQDQWKIFPNLTVTYGMRFEHDSNPVCQTNCFSRLVSDFGSVSNSADTPYQNMILSGQHSAFGSLQKVGYEPRIGFAYLPWGPDSKTTIRGGFGMFADAFPGQIADSFLNNAPGNVPFTILSQNFGNSNAPAAGYALNPTSAGSAGSVAAASNQAFAAGFAHGATLNSLSSVPGFSPPSIVTPYHHISYPTYEEWSLTVERQLTHTAALSIGYVGNHTYHQPIQDNAVNSFGFGGLPTNQPNENFGGATQIYSSGSSNYNGLVTSLVERSKWLTAQFNYVYSHALDNGSNGGFDGFGLNTIYPTNPYNFSQSYGNSDYDTRHYISASYVLTVPYWGGPKVLTDGWELSGTAFHNDGYPFSVTANTTASGIPFYGGAGTTDNNGALLAQQIAPIKNNHCGGGAHSINGTNPCSFITSFAEPTGLGQSRRNQIFGSSYTNTDMALAKSFPIPHWESAKLKLGVQAFNLFNHPNFQLAGGNIDSPSTFGFISSTVNTPTSILGSFLGGDASPRLLQLNAKFSF
jgi:hypothetical protein